MSGILKISEAAVLGLHSMVYISGHADGLATTKEIASFLRASEAHLAKVMQRLVKNGYVKSVRGPGGGFRLAKEPENITLREIYELFDGLLNTNNCLFESKVCGDDRCVFSSLLGNMDAMVADYLSKTTLVEASGLQTKGE